VQFLDRFHADQQRPSREPQVGLDGYISTPGDQLRVRLRLEHRDALVQRRRTRKTGHRECLKLAYRRVEAIAEVPVRRADHGVRGVANRPVARASTQVAARRQRVAWTVAIAPMLLREQAHHEAGRAVAALRTAAGRHRLLHLGEFALLRERFDGVELTVRRRWQRHQAGIDDPIGGAALLVGDHRHGTGAALTFGASFLGSREPARPDEVEQRYVRRDLTDVNLAAVEQERDAHTPRSDPGSLIPDPGRTTSS
jgi:hypothetical protein